MTDTVQLERDGAVAGVTINRPEALNALTPEMAEALSAALAELAGDPAVRCVVLRGAGEHFMAGGDVKVFHGLLDRPPEERRAYFENLITRVHPAIVSIRTMPKPVLASLRGAAAGFGLSHARAADLAVAAEDATFTLAYTRLGTCPDGGSSFHLPRLVGLRKALEIALLSDRFGAAEAARLGLVNRVVPTDALEAETRRLAERLAAGATAAFGRTKALMNRAFETDLQSQLDAEIAAFGACAAEPDFAEGVAAFVEKRPARFTGG